LSACALLVTLAMRPCGSHVANVFLILSKLGTFSVTTFVAVHVSTGKAWASEGADGATAVTGLIASMQILSQIAIAFVLTRKIIMKVVRAARNQGQQVQHLPNPNPPADGGAAVPLNALVNDDSGSSISLDEEMMELELEEEEEPPPPPPEDEEEPPPPPTRAELRRMRRNKAIALKKQRIRQELEDSRRHVQVTAKRKLLESTIVCSAVPLDDGCLGGPRNPA
jgi:hypothetical protein